jgi:TatA/E family protein of Tat protein translocase
MGLSFAEIGVVLLVALIVIGPDKLPKVAKSIGKGYAEFKRAFNDLKRAADINNIEVPPAKARDIKSVYKSRWEEEALKSEVVEQAQPEAKASSEQEPPAEAAETETAEASEVSEVSSGSGRAKRGDLIKGAD